MFCLWAGDLWETQCKTNKQKLLKPGRDKSDCAHHQSIVLQDEDLVSKEEV